MATYISLFRVNQLATGLDVIVYTEVGKRIQSVKVWNQDTYKDYTKALDFSSKLSQTSHTESFSITNIELSDSLLTGIYFIEVTDNTVPSADNYNVRLGVTSDFSRFVYCITEFLYKMDNCGECNQELYKALTMNLYIENLKNSLQLGNFTTAITFWKNLDRACKKSCVECSNLINPALKGLGFQTVLNEIILY